MSEAGLGSVDTILVGIAKLVATLTSVVFVEKFGRRKLLFVGISLMLTSLVLLTILFPFTSTDDDETDSVSVAQVSIRKAVVG